MKHFSLFLALAIFVAALSQCKNKPNTGNADTSPAVPADTQDPAMGLPSSDTVYIRDTIYRADTLRDAPLPSGLSLSASKGNVMYIAVDNPLRVDVPGFSDDDISISVSGSGSQIKKVGAGNYVLNFSKVGRVDITVSAGTFRSTFVYSVNRIPDPIARIAHYYAVELTPLEFKTPVGLNTFHDNFNFDVSCDIVSYNLTCIPRRSDPVALLNNGADYSAASRELVKRAKPGDVYYFTDVKVKCPGDNTARVINSLVFKIK